MSIINNYLNELFGYTITKKLTPPELGEKICSDLEKENQKKLKDDFEKKCGKIELGSAEKDICELKNKIYYAKTLVFDLMKNKYKCKRRSSCFDVISHRIYDIKEEIKDYEKDLKKLEKSKD